MDSDLLIGRKAIIRHLGLGDRQGEHMITRGSIPTFTLGGRRCATKSGLAAHFAELMANAGRDGPNPADLGASGETGKIVKLPLPCRVAEHAGGGARDDPATPLPVGLIKRQASPKGRAPISGAGESLESNCQATGDPSTGRARHATAGSEGSSLSRKGRTASA